MDKLKKLAGSPLASLDQKVKKSPKRILSVTGALAIIFIGMAVFFVACEEDKVVAPKPTPSVTTAATTTAKTTTTPEETTTGEQTTEPPMTTENSEETVPLSVDNPPQNNDVVFQDLSKTMYSLGDPVNVRESWSTSSTRVGTIPYGGEAKVTGYNASVGFYRVTFDGKTAYIAASYLSDTKPQAQQPNPNPQPQPQPDPKPNPQPQPNPDPPRQPTNATTPSNSFMREVMNYANNKGFGLTEYVEKRFWEDRDAWSHRLKFENSAYRVTVVFYFVEDGTWYLSESMVVRISNSEVMLHEQITFDPVNPLVQANGNPNVFIENRYWETVINTYS